MLVIGAGAIGLMTALILRQRGVRSLRIADLNPLRREAALRVGLEAFDPREAPPRADSVEAVFDCVGAGPTRKMAVASARPGGAIMHLGLQDNDGVTDTRAITLKELSFLGAYTYSFGDLRAAVALLDAGALGELSWVEKRPLAEGAAAFAELACGRSAARQGHPVSVRAALAPGGALNRRCRVGALWVVCCFPGAFVSAFASLAASAICRPFGHLLDASCRQGGADVRRFFWANR